MKKKRNHKKYFPSSEETNHKIVYDLTHLLDAYLSFQQLSRSMLADKQIDNLLRGQVNTKLFHIMMKIKKANRLRLNHIKLILESAVEIINEGIETKKLCYEPFSLYPHMHKSLVQTTSTMSKYYIAGEANTNGKYKK